MFKLKRFWSPVIPEDDLLTVKVNAFKKLKPKTIHNYPHRVIGLSQAIVLDLFKKSNPPHKDFDKANDLLWILAACLSAWLSSKKTNAQLSSDSPIDDKGNTRLHLISRLCLEAYNNGPGLSAWGRIKNIPGFEEATLSVPISYMFTILMGNYDVNQQNTDGDTALHFLATITEQNLGFEACGLLIANGTDAFIENKKGKSPYRLAYDYSLYSELPEKMSLAKESFVAEGMKFMRAQLERRGQSELTSRKLKI